MNMDNPQDVNEPHAPITQSVGSPVTEVIDVPSSSVAVQDRPAPAPVQTSRDVLNSPPEGWTIAAIPNLANLTIEYLCSSVAGEVFRTGDREAIAKHIDDIEAAKRVPAQPVTVISSQQIGAFGQAFGQ